MGVRVTARNGETGLETVAPGTPVAGTDAVLDPGRLIGAG
jgi:hypothetical protein